MMRRRTMVALGLSAGLGLTAQEAAPKALPIQDNSFMIEEAYNQEDGVIQHIFTYSRSQKNHDWLATFTQEWPAPNQKHQLSFTVPYLRMESSLDGRKAVGDVALNYRYQLLGDGGSVVAMSPRFSILLPTGDEKQLRGAGATGYQVNLPLSVALTERFVTHINLGSTYTPGARNAAGDKADLTTWNFGQSFIWLARSNVNAMLEIAGTSGEQVAGPALKASANTLFINPGFRCAINFKSGLQIVPGISFPIGVGPSKGERAVFFYVSFEHPLWRTK